MPVSEKPKAPLVEEDGGENPSSDEESEDETETVTGSPSKKGASNNPNGRTTPTKLKCLKCYRVARKGEFFRFPNLASVIKHRVCFFGWLTHHSAFSISATHEIA